MVFFIALLSSSVIVSQIRLQNSWHKTASDLLQKRKWTTYNQTHFIIKWTL